METLATLIREAAKVWILLSMKAQKLSLFWTPYLKNIVNITLRKLRPVFVIPTITINVRFKAFVENVPSETSLNTLSALQAYLNPASSSAQINASNS
ncbi:hypothetical protein GJ744_011804 [Endocarpon pusillum]|uniref:Uncharacterized protein n=1 Tax=Endocarpon pusillum TaxID=364733 RepID=A0A8H7DWI8_9EURO|nr:hypothetical protein GJ744_011804 [Endocarpon pusillum]